MLQLALIAFIILSIIMVRHIRQQPAEKRLPLTLRYGLYALVTIIIILVVTGRMHWIAAAIAATLPFIKGLIALGIRFFPFLSKWRKKQTEDQTSQTHTASKNMDQDQALKVFGFEVLPSEDAITKRHRELIQKNHPDRGGSDYLAAQINEAKDVLLDCVKNSA